MIYMRHIYRAFLLALAVSLAGAGLGMAFNGAPAGLHEGVSQVEARMMGEALTSGVLLPADELVRLAGQLTKQADMVHLWYLNPKNVTSRCAFLSQERMLMDAASVLLTHARLPSEDRTVQQTDARIKQLQIEYASVCPEPAPSTEGPSTPYKPGGITIFTPKEGGCTSRSIAAMLAVDPSVRRAFADSVGIKMSASDFETISAASAITLMMPGQGLPENGNSNFAVKVECPDGPGGIKGMSEWIGAFSRVGQKERSDWLDQIRQKTWSGLNTKSNISPAGPFGPQSPNYQFQFYCFGVNQLNCQLPLEDRQ